MIKSKPNFNTVFSLLLFFVIDLIIIIFLISKNYSASKIPIYIYLLIPLLGIIAFTILWKIIGAYKIITINKKKISIQYPLRFGQYDTTVQDISWWQEITINTNKTVYKQLRIKFKRKKTVRISLQENTNYTRIFNFLKKHAAKLQKFDN